MNSTRFQKIVDVMLMRHFGIKLKDTAYVDNVLVADLVQQGLRPFEVINQYVGKYELDRIDCSQRSLPLTASEEDVVSATIPSHFGLNDRLFDEKDAHKYDAIELQGVREHHTPGDPNDKFIETDNENPQFFSVYLHVKPAPGVGGVECIGDFEKYAMAQEYANELALKHAWPIHDYVAAQHKVIAPAYAGVLGKVVKFYENGEFSHVSSDVDVENSGDGLFRFLMTELAPTEDCDSDQEAVNRISSAIDQLIDLRQRIVATMLEDAPGMAQ